MRVEERATIAYGAHVVVEAQGDIGERHKNGRAQLLEFADADGLRRPHAIERLVAERLDTARRQLDAVGALSSLCGMLDLLLVAFRLTTLLSAIRIGLGEGKTLCAAALLFAHEYLLVAGQQCERIAQTHVGKVERDHLVVVVVVRGSSEL